MKRNNKCFKNFVAKACLTIMNLYKIFKLTFQWKGTYLSNLRELVALEYTSIKDVHMKVSTKNNDHACFQRL